MQYKNKLFIDGKWLDGEGGATFDVINPASEEVITKVASAGIEDAKKAISVASKIFDGDGGYSAEQITKLLNEIGQIETQYQMSVEYQYQFPCRFQRLKTFYFLFLQDHLLLKHRLNRVYLHK